MRSLPDLNFTIEVGPIATDEYMIVRWKAQRHYGGLFRGWANADGLLFFQQLGVTEVPALAARR